MVEVMTFIFHFSGFFSPLFVCLLHRKLGCSFWGFWFGLFFKSNLSNQQHFSNRINCRAGGPTVPDDFSSRSPRQDSWRLKANFPMKISAKYADRWPPNLNPRHWVWVVSGLKRGVWAHLNPSFTSLGFEKKEGNGSRNAVRVVLVLTIGR